MKRILHTIDTTGPGGAETVFLNLVAGLDASRYEPTVVIRGPGYVQNELRRRGIEPLVVEAKGSFNLRSLRELMRIVRQRRIDLIQSHLLGANVYCSLAGLATGRPVVATFHGAVDFSERERFRRAKFAIINRGADRIVFVSEHLRRQAEALSPLDPRKARVVYNGVDIDRFRARERDPGFRDELGIPAGTFLIGAIGNLRAPKGYDVLIRAAARMRQRGEDVRFVIVGDTTKGGLHQELLALCKELGVNEVVTFAGFQSDVSRILASLDLFVLSSLSEGFSIAAVEAMAAGVPVVATRSGGPEEIIEHGVDGLLVEPGSEEALAEALTALHADEPTRERLVAAAKNRVATRFSIQGSIAAYQGLYDELS